MPKSRKSLSSYVKKRRRNPGLLKWLQENKHTRSHLQASKSSCNTVVNKSLDMEMETEPKSNTICSETEMPMTQNEISHILLDHPYNKPLDAQTEPRSRLHVSFNESEITCSSTPQPDSTAQNKTSRRRLNMDVDEDKVHVTVETPHCNEPPFVINSSSNSTEGNVSDGVPVSRDVVGRRIINLAFFFEQIKQIDNHNRDFGCTISNCYVVSEKNNGLKFAITLKCNMCREKLFLHSEDPHLETMDVNTGSVAGAMAVGIGHYQMQELFAAMEIPYMSFKTYNKTHDKVADSWEETALDEMRAAVTEEVKFARENGHLSPDGTPVLTVVADGSWAKRSYRTNYNSLAGVAAIVGYHTKKVIFLGVRNKYCTICARAASTSTEARQHTCFKNWTGSSSSMEPDIILEGFMSSMEMYGVMYGRILADGDSSVYASIIEARPYPNLTVEKVECTNHLMRNYCNKVKEIALNTRSGPIHLRKVIGRNVMNLRRAVTGAVEYRASQSNTDSKKLEDLAKDIINGPSHVFGEHTKCETYFCKGPKPGEKNHILELKESGLYQQVMKHVNYLADNARSLILKMNNNPVEHYNSIIAKYIGGKRVNFAVKRSYKARCLAAAVSFNTGQPLYRLHKKMYNRSPGKVLKTLQTARSRKITNKHKKRQEKPRKPKSTNINRKERQENGKHYGEAAMKPDMPIDVFRRKAKDFLKSLKKTEEERKEIERATILQASSGRWMEERRKLVTASKYAAICKRRKTTSCKKLVRTLLYSKDFDTSSTAYGRQNEAVAIKVFEETTGLKVDKCGLFIDEEIPYLGASPDGLIGEDGLIEVKCPATCKNMSPEDGVMSGKFTFWNIDKQSNSIGPVNKSSDYFYQIQGQLHVTKRQFCYLVMWTPLGIRYERIVRDDAFWEEEMKEKLKKFYHDCLLPELVDPRHTRSMPIRDPPYIVDAMKKKEQKCKKYPKESKAN